MRLASPPQRYRCNSAGRQYKSRTGQPTIVIEWFTIVAAVVHWLAAVADSELSARKLPRIRR